MKRSNPPPEEEKTLPIHWIKPTAFKIPIPRDEKQRLAALYRYDILDTPPERTFDSIAVLASHVCAAPIALLVLIDRNRQWFKAKVGVRLNETPREFAFCTHTIMLRRLCVIPDVTRDRRFAANPFVVSGPQYRFYAGAPLVTPDNRALGTLCVIDKVVRMIFKVLPDVKIAWRHVWIGALLTALLFNLGKYLLGLYLGRSSVTSAYGAAGSLVIVLLWVCEAALSSPGPSTPFLAKFVESGTL